MGFLIAILALFLVIQNLRVRKFERESRFYKEEGLRFWKMYKDECEKNRWKGKLPGTKHEYGHDYE